MRGEVQQGEAGQQHSAPRRRPRERGQSCRPPKKLSTAASYQHVQPGYVSGVSVTDKPRKLAMPAVVGSLGALALCFLPA